MLANAGPLLQFAKEDTVEALCEVSRSFNNTASGCRVLLSCHPTNTASGCRFLLSCHLTDIASGCRFLLSCHLTDIASGCRFLLSCHLTDIASGCSLLLITFSLRNVTQMKPEILGELCFSFLVPSVWNSLPAIYPFVTCL